ncbi:MAG: DHA2 family efflux MFS transporter permease subunit [Pseudomonadota bacterium]
MTSDSTEAFFARYGPRYKWLVTATVMMGTISTVLSTTIVNVAMPDIMGAYGMGQDKVQWLATGFLAATTATMLLNAWLVHSFGQRCTYIGAMSLFLAASVLSGNSPNENLLIFYRVLQGAAAGILQPLAMYTLFRVFPPEERGSAMGIYGIGVVLAPALGPALGGVLVDNFSWHYVFYVAVPTSIAGILLANLFMPGREGAGPRAALDWPGFLLLSLFLAALLTGLSNGQREGWTSNYVLSLLGLAGTAGTAFIVRELRASQPMVDLRILANGRFAAAASVAFILGVGLFGSTYLVPLFVQTIQHLTPTQSGLLLMPAGLALGVVFPIAGRLSDRLAPHWPIIAGLFCFGLSSYWMGSVDVNTPFWTLAGWILAGRIGLGLIMPSLNAGALRALDPALLGQGSGVINFIRQLGGAFGVNLLSVFLDRRSFFYSDALTATQTAANSATAEFARAVGGLLVQAGTPQDLQLPGALYYLGRTIYLQASTMAFRDSFLLVALVFFAAMLPAWLMGRTKEA